MAIYFLNMNSLGRSTGRNAISAAAYRSGERLRDERTGRTYDHTERHDVLHKEILLPTELARSSTEWAQDRSYLWNAAESAEARKGARVAREYVVALPVELKPAQRLDLARGFSRELVDRYQSALDLTLHAPRDYPGSDPRNFHAHLLTTTREITTRGLGAKTWVELSDSVRREMGFPSAVRELMYVRERWATLTNEALRTAQVEARIDHRSAADRRRAEYETLMQARLDKELRAALVSSKEQPGPEPVRRSARKSHMTQKEAAAKAVRDWLRSTREAGKQDAEERTPRRARGKDDSLSL